MSPLTLAAIRQPAFLFEADGRISAANDLAEALADRPLGDSTAADVIAVLRVRRPDGTPVVPTELSVSRALAGEEAIDVPLAITASDGRAVHVLATASPLRDGDSVTGVLCVWQDVTERRRAETALESLARFPAENPNPVLRLADGRTIVYANPAALTMLGEPAGGPGREAADDIARMATTALASGTMQEMEYSKGDEAYLLSFVPVEDRHYVNIYGKSITKRKRAEAKIRESEEQVRNLIENSADGIIITDEKGWLTTWNRGMEMITGLVAGDVLGRPAWEIQAGVVNEEWAGTGYRARYRAIWDRLLQDGAYPQLNRLLDVQIRIPTGEIRHLQQMVFTTPTPRGFQVGGILRDITEQKRAEEALLRFTEDLRQSNEDLERFAYVSSHDLQEPLRSIVSFSQLLERRYKGRLDDDADDYIQFIVEGGNRMQDLIQDLLAYSRANTKRQELRPTDAEKVLAAVERDLAVQLREAGAVITHDPVPVVMADPLQLEQVFANLVSNAIKFRKPGEPLRVHVGARGMDGAWEFSVSDNGIGMETEYLERIFVIFQRLHTKDAYPGTGIGLAIAKRIVERHGGRIRVESTPGEGSTFFFTLPAA
ncbi:MAG TPA: PAS domain S-box protein [Methanoregulaceae archaeon]|nr:PAS domain S-box protein [Methanoregulaceae archaeon]